MMAHEGKIYEAEFSRSDNYLPINGKWKGIYRNNDYSYMHGA
jgi:hypothetical protein